MPRRDADLLIEDIQTAIARIERYLSGMGRDQFLADEKTIDAVVRNLEIIGEAVRWLPEESRRAMRPFRGRRSPDCATESFTITSAWTWKSSGASSTNRCRNSSSISPRFATEHGVLPSVEPHLVRN